MTRRVVIGVEQDARGRIIALYGEPDQGWSPITTREAVETIRAGVHTYVAVGARGSAGIHLFHGSWLRTRRNLTFEDNLDALGGPDYAHLGAGAYGITVTLSPAGVDALARELHASGAIVDRLAVCHDDLFVTALLGVPRFEFSGGAGRCEIVRDALCHVRRANDPHDEGTCAVATVTAVCDVTTRVNARSGFAGFTLTYSVPPQGAVRLEAPVSDPAREALMASLTDWVASSRVDRWDLPLAGPIAGAKSVDVNVDTAGHPQVGVRFDAKKVGEFPSPRPEFAWTVALSRPYVVQRVGAAVRSYLGGLPAPLGSDSSVAVPGSADVALTYLEVGLVPGAVVISGIAVRGRSATVTAHFTANFSLALDADGLVAATLGDTTVDVVEWYAQVADFLSGGKLVAGIQEGMRGALGALGVDAAAGLLNADLLTRIVASGTAQRTAVTAMPRRVWIEPGALHLGGDFERAPLPPHIVAVPLGRRLDITMLATPGATVREIRWEANGAAHVETYEQRKVSWTPPAAARTATVTVVTDEGESAAVTVAVSPPSA